MEETPQISKCHLLNDGSHISIPLRPVPDTTANSLTEMTHHPLQQSTVPSPLASKLPPWAPYDESPPDIPDLWVSFLCPLSLTLLESKSPNQNLQTRTKVFVNLVPIVEIRKEPISLVSTMSRSTTLLGSRVPLSRHLRPLSHPLQSF